MKKHKKLKRLVSLILTLCLLAALGACSGGANSESDAQQETSNNGSTDQATYSTDQLKTYSAEYNPLPFEAAYVSDVLTDGDKLYFCYNTARNDEYTYYIASTDTSGGDFSIIQEAKSIGGAAIGSGGLWTLSSDDGEIYKINSFSVDGAMIGSFDLPEEVDTNLLPRALNVDGEGNIYYTAYNDSTFTVYVMEQDGTLNFELTKNEIPMYVITTKEGTVGICSYDMAMLSGSTENYNFELSLIDAKTQSWGGSAPLGIPSSIYGGSTNSFYINDSTNVYSYDVDTGKKEAVFSWLDIGVVSDAVIAAEMEDGKFAAVCGKINYSTLSYSYEFCIIGLSDVTEQAAKQVISLSGIVYNQALAVSVAEFNKKSDKYKIEYNTYLQISDAVSIDAVNDALTRFNMDILSGNISDIMDMSNMSVDLYAAKGLLEDLYTYIDADPELDRSGFFENVLEAMSSGGKLSYITNGIYIYTMFARAETFGSEPGVTAAEFGSILSEYPDMTAPLGVMVSKSNFLTYILYGNVDFIDWSAGKCYFSSPEFIQLLEIANRMPLEPGEYDYSDMQSILESSRLVTNGSQAAAIESIYAIEQIAAYNQLLGSDLNIVGLPSSQGVCHVIDAPIKLTISTHSQNKEAAWEFMRMLLQEDVQESNIYIPISRAAFDKLMKNAVDGNSLFSAYYPDMEITEDDIAVLKSLVESATYSTSYDQVVMSIVEEESEAFFAGKTTAQQAAEFIQNRIQTYISEQT